MNEFFAFDRSQARAAQRRKLEGLLADEARAVQVRRAVRERASRVDELLHAERYLESLRARIEHERAALARLEGQREIA